MDTDTVTDTRTVYTVWCEALHKDGTGWSRTFDRIEDAEDLALRLAVTSGRTTQIVETVITVTL
jgi:hypothetical protein